MPPTADGRLRELIWALVVLAREAPALTCEEPHVRPYPARFGVHHRSTPGRVEIRVWPDERRARIHVTPRDGDGPGSVVDAMTVDLSNGYWLGRPAGPRSGEGFGGQMYGSATSAAEGLLGHLGARLRASSRRGKETGLETA